MDGIIVLNKPAGWTSMDCCAVIRGVCRTKKVGHTGTLDPNATGVLPVCVGKATRLIEYMDFGPKKYRAGCRLGMVTDTQDIWGNVISEQERIPRFARNDIAGARNDIHFTRNDIEDALNTFIGEIQQVPPAYSAIKINGKKLYEYARAGKTVEVEPRTITIHGTELLEFDEEKGELLFDVTCSRGTYVRTICHDLGQKLGCGAVMSSLVRLSTCGYSLDQAVTIEELKENGPGQYLLPLETAVSEMPRIDLDPRQAWLFSNGVNAFFKKPEIADSSIYSVFHDERLVGTAKPDENGDFKPLKVFKE